VYGFDGGKQVKGRKRHLVVDSQGFMIGVVVTEANASERLGAVVVSEQEKEKLSRLEVIWVDQGYSAPISNERCRRFAVTKFGLR
jgi:transposase